MDWMTLTIELMGLAVKDKLKPLIAHLLRVVESSGKAGDVA
jgi:hypothetical protein